MDEASCVTASVVALQFEPASAVTVIDGGSLLVANLNTVVGDRVRVRVAKKFAVSQDLPDGGSEQVEAASLAWRKMATDRPADFGGAISRLAPVDQGVSAAVRLNTDGGPIGLRGISKVATDKIEAGLVPMLGGRELAMAPREFGANGGWRACIGVGRNALLDVTRRLLLQEKSKEKQAPHSRQNIVSTPNYPLLVAVAWGGC